MVMVPYTFLISEIALASSASTCGKAVLSPEFLISAAQHATGRSNEHRASSNDFICFTDISFGWVDRTSPEREAVPGLAGSRVPPGSHNSSNEGPRSGASMPDSSQIPSDIVKARSRTSRRSPPKTRHVPSARAPSSVTVESNPRVRGSQARSACSRFSGNVAMASSFHGCATHGK